MKSRGYSSSLETVMELDPHLFAVSLQYRNIVPRLPDVDVLCIASNCFNDATHYAVYEGKYEAVDGITKFGIAPVCNSHDNDDVAQGDVVRWTKTNVILYP